MKRRPEYLAAVLAGIRAGRRQSELAAEFGVTRQAICNLLRRNGHSSQRGRPRLPRMSEADRRHYEKMRQHMGAAWAREAMGLQP